MIKMSKRERLVLAHMKDNTSEEVHAEEIAKVLFRRKRPKTWREMVKRTMNGVCWKSAHEDDLVVVRVSSLGRGNKAVWMSRKTLRPQTYGKE